MLEAELSLTESAHDQNRYRGDETLLVKFYKHPAKDEEASQKAGRPIFKEVDYIDIMTPGNKDSRVSRRVRPTDLSRFPEHWRRYETRQTADYIEGTLLEQWPGVTRAQVEELKFFNIRTVEQLVAVSDANGQKIMGINSLKKKAKEYLEASEIAATAEALAEKDSRIAQLEEALNSLASRMAELENEEIDEQPAPAKAGKK